MLEAIITAVVAVTGIGLLCAVGLVIASVFMSVEENPLEKEVRECLPGVNCGACGYSGCDGYAKALAENKDVKTNLCTVSLLAQWQWAVQLLLSPLLSFICLIARESGLKYNGLNNLYFG